ncbi:hypothetical protein AYL99_06841 [Fonsecaea erecta]|uniref:Uncharacterized protein n=1 Tax=Fonsecaea erecta TaxID=1367422 RepID=A0A178ZK33_9EURO|nr:hypothetical protein AYL99_06841 [Fonsecaea erecta]OAP59543.1 hypothetical protein AYL99_06841 [Fonsecaea erecta]
MSSSLLHATPERYITGAALCAFPNVCLKREDFLSTTVIKPPRPNSSPNPPSSGLSELVEDVDVMFSRTSNWSARKKLLDLEEMVTLSELGRYSPPWQQSPDISESTFEPAEEGDNDDDERYEETVQAQSSKYDVKPPARHSTRFEPWSAPPRSTPRSALRSPENNVDDVEEPGPPEHNLRKRTLQQTNPYKFDKHRHQLSWKTGREASSNKVETAVREEIGVVDKQMTTKKP